MMRMSRSRLVIGIPSVIFGSIMTIVPIIFLDAQMFTAFVTFSITAKTGDKVREVIIDLLFLFPCYVYILWDRTEFELIYQIITLIMLLFLVPNFLSTMLRKVTVDFRTIAVRNSLGVTKTYEIRQITEVAELENHIVLYAGEQKIVKIAKSSKNFQYLFSPLNHPIFPVTSTTAPF